MADYTKDKRRSLVITLGVILFVVLVALFKSQAAERRWLRTEPVADRVAAFRAVGQPLVVFFHSPDCRSCEVVKQSLDQAYPEFKDTVSLLDVDVTNPRERSFVNEVGVKTAPAFLFIDSHGNEQLVAGEVSPAELRGLLSALAGGAP